MQATVEVIKLMFVIAVMPTTTTTVVKPIMSTVIVQNVCTMRINEEKVIVIALMQIRCKGVHCLFTTMKLYWRQ